MKNVYFLILISSWIFPVAAQNKKESSNSILARSTVKGVFLQFTGKEVMGHSLELYRKGGAETSFKKIASITPLASKADLEQRIAEAQKVFSAGITPRSEGVDAVWTAYQNKSSRDTLKALVTDIPQLEYVFNTAYLDKDVAVNQRYYYQLQEKQKVIATSSPILYTGRYAFPDLSGMRDTLIGRTIRFRLPWTKEFNYYVLLDAKRKMFTQKQSEFAKASVDVETLKEGKVTFTTFTDRTLPDLSEYNYQFRMTSVFGDADTTRYFYTASNVAYQYRPMVTSLKVKPDPTQRAFRVSWAINAPKLVQSVTLYRSDKMEGKYIPVGNYIASDSVTIDPVQVANELYFYHIEVNDIFNHKTTSIKIHEVYEGTHVPTPPYDVSVTGSKETVKLSWKSSDLYTRGFYVFRKKGLEGDYQQVSAFVPVVKNGGSFIDSARLDAANSYYYAIAAESDTYHKGKLSDSVAYRPAGAIESLKPPLDMNAVFRNNKVVLTWENRNLIDPETVGYHLYRKKKSEKDFTLLTKEPVTVNRFADSTLLANVAYEYTLTSVDGSGNQSMKSIPVSIDLSGRFRTTPERLGFELVPAGIKIKWTSLDVKQIASIQIYRALENENFKLLTTVAKESSSYTDRGVVKGKLYSYRLVITEREGGEGNTTKALLINY